LDPVAHAELHALRFLEGEDKWFCPMQEGWPLLDSRLQEEVRHRMSTNNIMHDPIVAQKMAESMSKNGVYEKHSERMKESNPMKQPEIAAKVSAAKKGQPSSRRGAVLSKETKEKLRQANLGKKHTPESRAKMSASRVGKTRGPYKKKNAD
jgi:response regulator of citrate/malate metabolism